MRKSIKSIIALCILVLLFLAIGCKDEPSNATLRVELNKGTRTISPNDSSMDITGYRIIPTGPDGKATSTRYTYYSYCNLEDISLGQWTIEAYGFNSERIDIAYGKADTVVTGNNDSVTITVNKIIGKGSLSIAFTWNNNDVESPSLKLFLKSQDSTADELEVIPSVTKSEGKANLELSDLDAGSYTLRGELFDNNEKVAGFIEAIRITNEKTTKGTIPLETGKLEEKQSSTSTVNIANTTSTPIEVAIEGVEKLVSKNTSFNVTLSLLTPKLSTNQIKTTWYLDGTAVGTGLSCVIKPTEIGDHRIDVVVSTKDSGSTGSAFATFTSVTTTRKGMPYSLKLIKNNQISLGSSNVIRFIPNGRLLVASNDLKTLELLSLESGELEKLKTYRYEDLSIDGIVSDIAASAIPADTSLTVYVFTNNNPEIVALSYTKTGESLSYKAKQTNIKDNNGNKIETLGPAVGISNGSYLKAVAVGAATSNHNTVGILFLNPNPSTSSTTFIDFMSMSDFIFGEGVIYSLDFCESSSIVTAVSGSTGIAYLMSLADSGQIAPNPTPLSDDLNKLKNKNYESFTNGITGRIMNPTSGVGYVLTSNALNIYAMTASGTRFICQQSNKSFKFTKHLNKIPALSGSYDNLFFYMLDNLCKKLYVLTFEDGEFACNKDEDYIVLPSTEYNKMEISRDGKYIVLYNPSCPTKDIALLSVTR